MNCDLNIELGLWIVIHNLSWNKHLERKLFNDIQVRDPSLRCADHCITWSCINKLVCYNFIEVY